MLYIYAVDTKGNRIYLPKVYKLITKKTVGAGKKVTSKEMELPYFSKTNLLYTREMC